MKILSERDPIEVFSDASEILNKAVEHTLGPEGTNTAVHFQNFYNIINDGKSIVEQLTSIDPELAPAMETLKQSAFETNRKAGDGTTSTIIIMNRLIKGARKYLNDHKDRNKVYLANRLLDTEKKLQDLIKKQKVSIDDKLYERVAKVSLGSSEHSQLVAEAFTFLDGDGAPALVKSDIPGVELEKIDGVNLTKTSVASSMFIDLLPSKELENVQVITLFQVIDRFEEMFQLVKLLNQNKDKYTILLYNEISSSALENLLFNLSQDRSKIIPICMKNYGKDMNNLLDEIAHYTETDIIDGGSLKTTDVSKIRIGSANKAILSQESLVLIRNEIPEYDYRLISRKACLIRAGGATKIDMEDTYRRLEDAIYSLAGAIKNGAFFGGYGLPYRSLANDIDDVDVPKFIVDALSYINKNIFNENADSDAVDSALVVSEVIRNSFYTAAQVITTNAIIYDNIR